MRRYIMMSVLTLGILPVFYSCKKYLDVVPDNVATIDNAFTMRSQAEKFLFTCYSYMPKDADPNLNPAINGGDEVWRLNNSGGDMFNIARGFQNIVNPYGDNYWSSLYMALRDCNIFLENIDKVPDLSGFERSQWVAEVKFLKAYYHFCLVRMYGPVPIIKVNKPIDADENEVRVPRDPVDSCFAYIDQLINEAREDLPLSITDPSKLGHITRPIALALRAKVLVTAASPLFNGNTDQAGLKNADGTQLFNQVSSKEKWNLAATACKEAIDLCHQQGMELYTYKQGLQEYNLSDTIKTQLSIRNSVTEKWNSEIIWANTQSYAVYIQQMANQRGLDPAYSDNTASYTALAPPLKIAEMFYTQNGVPITEDKTWNYAGRYSMRVAAAADKLYIRRDYLSAYLNFNREPRFYADLGFDGGIWYGQGRYNDRTDQDLFYIMGKKKQIHGFIDDHYGPITGYLIKKLVHYQNVAGAGSQYSITSYPWPLMRLADLYLLYSEALNESEGPGSEVYRYINLVRSRAGLPSVEYSWETFSTDNKKYTTQNGLRSIIHQERVIELAFEGHRLWDLKRWKEAVRTMNSTIAGWDINQESAEAYYRPLVIFNQTFGTKDYFWPIKDNNIIVNNNLVQNLGW